MRAVAGLFFCAILQAQTTGNLSIVNGKIDFSGAVHTATMIVAANVAALPATGCTVGEVAIVIAATLGQQMYQNSGSGACVWTQQLNTGSSNGGGITVYSAASLTLTGTQFIPIGGGGLPSATETNVDTASPSAATVTNFDVQMSAAPGMGNSIAFTWRKNASSQSLTCTISGAVATSCSDTTHSFSVSQGDLLTIQIVTTGVLAGTPNLVTSVQFGTTGSNGTVNTGTAHQTAVYPSAGTAVSGAGPGSSGQVLTSNGAGSDPTYQAIPAATHNVTFVLNGGGSTITSGDAFTYIGSGPLSGTINRVDISGGGTAGATCSITVDIWKRNAAIPSSANKISASAPATLSTANLSQSGSLSGWSTSVSANDVWDANVATVTGCVQVIVQVWYQ